MLSMKKIFEVFFSSILSLLELMSPGCANLDPMGYGCRIYVGDHITLLNTKYLSCVPHGFREEHFF